MHVDEASSVQFYASMRPTIAGHGNLAGSREEENSRWAICCTREGPPDEPGLLGAGLAVGLLACYCWATMVMLLGQRMGPSLSLNLGPTKNIKSKTKYKNKINTR